MVESGNELQRDRLDVPRGHSNIKGISQRRLTLRRASRGVRGSKLRESRLKVRVQLVGGFLRVVPGPSVSTQCQTGAGRSSDAAAPQQEGEQRISPVPKHLFEESERPVQAVRGMENWERMLLAVRSVSEGCEAFEASKPKIAAQKDGQATGSV